MIDFTADESQNGVRLSWNILPTNSVDLQRYIVPCGIHYTPLKKKANLEILEYEPIQCKTCKSVLAPTFQVDFRSKSWTCPFCENKHMFPKEYANYISEDYLPVELLADSSTIEYKLNRKEAQWPVFVFVIDTTVEESELQELKESIQSTLSNIPSECGISVITYGTMCNLVELSFTECSKMFVFKGDKKYKPNEIAEQLGLINKNDPRNNNQLGKKYIVPLKDCEFSLNSFLDDLFPDPFPKRDLERKANCSGLALNVAISLLEAVHNNEPGRIMLFSGGACNIGSGKIVDIALAQTIRNYLDFEKKNENTNYFKEAIAYYESLGDRAFKAGQVIDIFSCCLNQIGLLEMKFIVEKSGGQMVLTDSFSTSSFKDTFKKIFELNEDGGLKMCFKAKIEMYVTKPLKIKGALGHLVSLEQNTLNLAMPHPIGEGKSNVWNLGGLDSNTTATFVLDIDPNNTPNMNYRFATIQFFTTYIASDKTTRLRVTTIKKKHSANLFENKYEVAQGFDQEAAAVLLAKIGIDMGYKEEKIEVLRWIDKTLINLANRFAEYTKDVPSSFKLTKEFAYFPQFVFYLRRSYVVQNFNASPDEITHFKTCLLRDNVTNCTIMFQPALFSYTPEQPESIPVFLEITKMKSDVVLLLDAFFFICIWHGEDVCRWRDAGYQYESDYENIKLMLESPHDYAQKIILERIPTPRFVSADYGTGQERLIKSVLDPNIEGNTQMKEGYFVSDDVSLKVFMDHLIKKAVQS